MRAARQQRRGAVAREQSLRGRRACSRRSSARRTPARAWSRAAPVDLGQRTRPAARRGSGRRAPAAGCRSDLALVDVAPAADHGVVALHDRLEEVAVDVVEARARLGDQALGDERAGQKACCHSRSVSTTDPARGRPRHRHPVTRAQLVQELPEQHRHAEPRRPGTAPGGCACPVSSWPSAVRSRSVGCRPSGRASTPAPGRPRRSSTSRSTSLSDSGSAPGDESSRSGPSRRSWPRACRRVTQYRIAAGGSLSIEPKLPCGSTSG